MVDLSFVTDFVMENLLLPSVNSRTGTEFVSRCPICGDSKKSKTKRRFHLRYESEERIYYHCFNCHDTGSFLKLYAFVKGMSVKEAIKELRKFDPDKIKKALKTKKKERQEIKQQPQSQNFNYILNDCIGVNSTKLGHRQVKLQQTLIEFKQNRKIDFPVFIAYKGRWKDRIIIPVIENSQIIYFQGRSISDELQPKYLNPTAEKEHVILNKEKFEKDKHIIITEGLLDAMSIGFQGTACLGASITDDFITLLLKYSPKIVIALDNDTTGYVKLRKLLEESKYASQISFFLMPETYKYIKDLNELKVKYSIDNLYSFIEDNIYASFMTKFKLKTEKWRS